MKTIKVPKEPCVIVNPDKSDQTITFEKFITDLMHGNPDWTKGIEVIRRGYKLLDELERIHEQEEWTMDDQDYKTLMGTFSKGGANPGMIFQVKPFMDCLMNPIKPTPVRIDPPKEEDETEDPKTTEVKGAGPQKKTRPTLDPAVRQTGV